MPFKSEKQRKYLWANEPEIARDWTDTYGSRIQKEDGGNIRLQPHEPRDLLVGSVGGTSRQKYQPPGYDSPDRDIGGQTEAQGGQFGSSYGPGRGASVPPSMRGAAPRPYVAPNIVPKSKPIRDTWKPVSPRYAPTVKKEAYVDKIRRNLINKRLWSSILQDREDLEDLAKGPREGAMHMGFKGFDPKEEYDFSGLKSIATEFKDPSTKRDILYPSKSKLPSMLSIAGNMFQPKATKEGALNTLNRITQAKEFLDKGMTQSEFNEFFPGPDKPTDGGGEGGQYPWWLQQQAPVAAVEEETVVPDLGLGSGHFQVPIEYVVDEERAADGGRIGFFKGAEAEAREEGKAMSPGTSASGGTRSGGEWSPGVGGTQHIPTPRPDPKPTPDRFPGGGIRTINPPINPYINKGPSMLDNFKEFISWNTDDDETPATHTLTDINPARNVSLGSGLAEGAKQDIMGAVDQGTQAIEESGVLDELRAQGVLKSQGGRIGYQMGNMVGAEMEGAEMEGAMMQSKEVITKLYEALIAQGLSPEEAMKKIREIIAAAQAEEPESPMMGEEFPGQEFGGGPRAPAAFGGIMDTYTGRRAFGLGDFVGDILGGVGDLAGKAVKKIKRLAKSKVGRLALSYLATAGLANVMAPGPASWSGGLGKQGWLRPGQVMSNLSSAWAGDPTKTVASGYKGLGAGAVSTAGQAPPITFMAGTGTQIPQHLINPTSLTKGVGSGVLEYMKKNPMATILGGSLLAGATAKETEEVGGVEEDYNKELAKWEKYLSPMKGAYRVPEEFVLPGAAQGGRIGRQEGGLMNLGGMEKDYRNDGGFVHLGGEEKADDVPARLSKNEFVFTADAVRNAGGGDIDRGAEVMENVMKNLEGGGQISEESQGQGAQEMFEVSERLSEVI